MLVQSVHNMLQLFRTVHSAFQLQHRITGSLMSVKRCFVPQSHVKQSQRWCQINLIPQDYKLNFKGKQTITTMYAASRLRLESAILVILCSTFVPCFNAILNIAVLVDIQSQLVLHCLSAPRNNTTFIASCTYHPLLHAQFASLYCVHSLKALLSCQAGPGWYCAALSSAVSFKHSSHHDGDFVHVLSLRDQLRDVLFN